MQVLHMIMGLERLDRITAFMEEHSGAPQRSSMEPIHEAGQEGPPPGIVGAPGRVSNADGQSDSRRGSGESEADSALAQRRMSGQHAPSRMACICAHADSAALPGLVAVPCLAEWHQPIAA